MIEHKLSLSLLKDKFGVCRLDINEAIPSWGTKGEFFSITKTADELSIVCNEENIPSNIKCEVEWKALKIEGPLDFSLIGILSKISSLLAKDGISIFAISTYDTDYILVKESHIENAISVLLRNEYDVIK
ncbi:hypothetical protein JOC70_001443 [Clostridium pascui]|uniref:ACT domain-containing protein n=1 Tax=Clostridium pascui TaxID=46609 RepID=UPI00195F23EF|nr:ACT domain-containing protein [Clostridium pascui]MBM7869973.1 hypothetical protein [Clostridium pascui]